MSATSWCRATDLLGDGVNIAARLEQMAEPGGILVSGTVWEQIQGKLSFPCSYCRRADGQEHRAPGAHLSCRLGADGRLGAALGGPPKALALPDKPSIAVLPFTNMGSDAEQEYFADGISEDIITALSKSRWLFVIARNTSFVYKGKAVDIKQVGRELGVRYVLEGSVRKAGNRVRITAQLIEAATGTHLWAERYDRDLADTFAVQDEITESVVGAIEPELLHVERQRAARKSPENMDAWDHYMRGMWRFYQFNPEAHERAERLHAPGDRARPDLRARAYGPGTRSQSQRSVVGWSENRTRDRQGAYAAARRAVELDDQGPVQPLHSRAGPAS